MYYFKTLSNEAHGLMQTRGHRVSGRESRPRTAASKDCCNSAFLLSKKKVAKVLITHVRDRRRTRQDGRGDHGAGKRSREDEEDV